MAGPVTPGTVQRVSTGGNLPPTDQTGFAGPRSGPTAPAKGVNPTACQNSPCPGCGGASTSARRAPPIRYTVSPADATAS